MAVDLEKGTSVGVMGSRLPLKRLSQRFPQATSHRLSQRLNRMAKLNFGFNFLKKNRSFHFVCAVSPHSLPTRPNPTT